MEMLETRTNYIIHRIHKIPARYRIVISLSVALITYFLTKKSTASVQFIQIWISFCFSSLILFWVTICTAQRTEVKMMARKQDSSLTLIFFSVLIASFVSLFAIVLLLRGLPEAKNSGYKTHIIFSIIAVVLSWVLIHTIFTFRYAHLFYTWQAEEKKIHKERQGGLIFPNDDPPDYFDFAYFAFVIGMTFQVSDVQITSRHIRRLALLHGLLSFVYNTVILALSINIISGLIEK
jgi:uncharacterized membrane protein